jgi:hypothetical protein
MDKVSAKGITKYRLKDPFSDMKQVLTDGVPKQNSVIGFQAYSNTILTNHLKKRGMSYFYVKRRVLDDGISTEPLDMVLSLWTKDNRIIISNDPLMLFRFTAIL